VIERLVNCGERVENEWELRQHIQWFLAFAKPNGLTTAGEMLVTKLQEYMGNTMPSMRRTGFVAQKSQSQLPPSRFAHARFDYVCLADMNEIVLGV
jgi:hypothetical protein